MTASSLWRGQAPFLLASTSATRKALLESAGLPVETEAPGVDERALEVSLGGAGPGEIALRLAGEKALAVSRRRPDRVVVGADQTLHCDGTLFHKPADRAAARDQLAALSGRTHVLQAAVAIAEAGAVVHAFLDEARLTLRDLTRETIDRYLDIAGDHATRSVGAYQLEGLGIHLFERVEGDHSTILGLPLLPLLGRLRGMGLLTI